MRTLGISRDSPWTHIAWMQALDLTVGLLSGLERGGGAGLRRGAGLPGHAGHRTADRVPDRSRRRVQGAWSYENDAVPDFDELLAAARAL